MLKTFFGKTFGSSGEKGRQSEKTSQARLELERIKTIIEFFPIGKKLRYYPEFNKDIVLDTLVVAYCVNGNFIYSLEAIERDSEGLPTAFRAGENNVHIAASGLQLFQLLVPDTSHLEMKLDYQRRAQIGRGGQFSKGNYISLVSNAGAKGVSTVDTEVAKHVALRDGPYAQMNLILLTPELKSLAVTDQRMKNRTKTNVPIKVFLPEEKFSWLCTMVDISEGSFRIRVSERGAIMPPMVKGDGMIVQIELGEAERQYSIKGSVIRRASETCVVRMDGQIKDGRLVGFSPLDLLELKAGLLNYSK